MILARGGPAQGFALAVRNGRCEFHLRSDDDLKSIRGKKRVIGGWHHVVGVLGEDKTMRLYLDGKLEAEGTAHKLIASDPAQAMEIGTDGQSFVGDYKNAQFSGVIDDVRLYFREATAEQIVSRFDRGTEIAADAVLAVSFDDGSARDLSLHQNHGSIKRAKSVEGKVGQGFSIHGG